jgi:hypothetical protein
VLGRLIKISHQVPLRMEWIFKNPNDKAGCRALYHTSAMLLP